MLELFTNPGYLAAGAALISAPIIIHLINRMRFRRIRWAAMEFLLKSQKRNRRRLIIEQLILLALRCLLVALTALLVLRFVGLSLAGFESKEGLHVVVLDDTLSMTDRWKDAGEDKNSFDIAKSEVIVKSILKNIAQSTTNERLAIIPLSKLAQDPGYQPVIYQKLGDPTTEKEILSALEQMKPSQMYVDMLLGVKRAESLFNDDVKKRPFLHIVSDLRRRDWTGVDAQQLHKLLLQLADSGVEISLKDAAHPVRDTQHGGVQLAHDNVGILDFRAGTRVVGKGMPVTFTVTVANYSPTPKKVNVVVYNEQGQPQDQIDFNPPMPLDVPAHGTASASFIDRVFDVPADAKYTARKLVARLESAQRTPLEDDGLLGDNLRYASVEVREKVPVLVIDGEGPRGRSDGKDSFFIENAIISVPGGSYQIVYGDELSGSNPTKALERPDLLNYPTIFILNVAELTKKQRDNLEAYVREGGGVAFFVGPLVSGEKYTKDLYRDGQGVFPVPLESTYHPQPGQPALELTQEDRQFPQMLLRKDEFGSLQEIPIFGAVFGDTDPTEFLKDLPINRYFKVPRSDWIKTPGKVFEMATLPNKSPALAYKERVAALISRLPIGQEEYAAYDASLRKYRDLILNVAGPASREPSFKLAEALRQLLEDRGDKDKGIPDMRDFWASPDPKIRTLKQEVQSLYEATQFGDPLVVAQQFGKGRVVAVMTTAGKDWNAWGGGSIASFIYQPFIWEMQNYLSSQTAESNLMVGSGVEINVDMNKYKKQGANQVFIKRTFFRTSPEKQLQKIEEAPNFGTEMEKNIRTFRFDNNLEPGFYLSSLYDQANPAQPLEAWGHVFNVDTAAESNLSRAAQEDLQEALLRNERIKLKPWTASGDEYINRRTDLSESPFLFLAFLLVLVSEQALAVHLSFHLRATEGQTQAVALGQGRRVAAA